MPQTFIPTEPLLVEFYLARSHAINEYAKLETTLFFLFAQLMEAKYEYAAIPFFKINNARARKEILEKMLRKRCGDKYSLFWNSLGNHLTGLDQRRNEIVHWAILGHAKDGRTLDRVTLSPAAWWTQEPGFGSIELQHLMDFADKCDTIGHLVSLLMADVIKPNVDAPWPKIFAEPVLYPIPAGHPLFRIP
jgi:hypothetical protein